MASVKDLNLLPPLFEPGHLDELILSGQTLSTSLSPFDNSLAIFVTNIVSDLIQWRLFIYHLIIHLTPQPEQNPESHPEDLQPVYFASLDSSPSSERRLVGSVRTTWESCLIILAVHHRHACDIRSIPKFD